MNLWNKNNEHGAKACVLLVYRSFGAQEWGPWALRSLASCRMPRYWDRVLDLKAQSCAVCHTWHIAPSRVLIVPSALSTLPCCVRTIARGGGLYSCYAACYTAIRIQSRWGTVFVLRCLLHCYTYRRWGTVFVLRSFVYSCWGTDVLMLRCWGTVLLLPASTYIRWWLRCMSGKRITI